MACTRMGTLGSTRRAKSWMGFIPLTPNIAPSSRIGVFSLMMSLAMPINDAGQHQVEMLNAGFDHAYLENPPIRDG